MEHRPLGSSGIDVSVLSLGSWRTYERIPREQSLAVMDAARRPASTSSTTPATTTRRAGAAADRLFGGRVR